MIFTAQTASALHGKLHTLCRCQAKPMCFQSHQVRSMAGGLNLCHQQVPCSSTEKQNAMSQTMQKPMQLPWVESPHTCTPTQLKQLPQSDSTSDEVVTAASEYSTIVSSLTGCHALISALTLLNCQLEQALHTYKSVCSHCCKILYAHLTMNERPSYLVQDRLARDCRQIRHKGGTKRFLIHRQTATRTSM